MARNRRPSFLTKQKEMQRRDKATKKREERRLRKSRPSANADLETMPADADADSGTEAEVPSDPEPPRDPAHSDSPAL